MIKNRKVVSGMMAASMCTCVFSGVNVYAAEQDGFKIENGILKGIDESISGEITIPSNVEKIDLDYSSEKITKITIPGNVKSIKNSSFYNVDQLTEVDIKENVEFIGDNCFAGCDNLKKVTIPSSVTQINHGAFSDCKNLTEVELKSKTSQIGLNVFRDTPWLNNQKNNDKLVIVNGVLLDGRDASGSVVVPEEVKLIQEDAFAYNTNLKEIKINAKEIGNFAFRGCENLEKVELCDGVEVIGEDAFYECKSIVSVNIPNSVTKVGGYSFSDNTKITGNTELYKKAKESMQDAIDGSYLDRTMYRIPNGWNTYDGKRYYKREDGTKQTGWMDLNGRTYYFYGNGVQASGFIDLNGTHYYLDPNGSGDDFGKIITGWKSIDGNWYYFSPQAEGDKVKGFMKTAWLNNNGNWYYFYSDGKMATGFINLNGTYYYLDESNTSNIGIMKTGWQKINGYWYYFNQKSDGGTEGVMSKGWRNIDGVWYYFYFGDGKMAADTWIDGYYVNSSGAWVK